MDVIFRSASGKSIDNVLLDLKNDLTPTVSDIQFLTELLRSEIREHTDRGVDAQGIPFKPYSTAGPYYYNPSAKSGATGIEAQKAAKRIQRMLHERGLPGELSLSKTTIRFDNYGVFKASLGRLTVDLLGADAPHMLDAMQTEALSNTEGKLFFNDSNAELLAKIHNFGMGRQPERRFFEFPRDFAQKAISYFRERYRNK